MTHLSPAQKRALLVANGDDIPKWLTDELARRGTTRQITRATWRSLVSLGLVERKTHKPTQLGRLNAVIIRNEGLPR